LHEALPGRFDLVFCTLVLHHFADEGAVRLLSKMKSAACLAVLVDDLRRSRAGYAMAWVGTRVLSRSHVVHTDGPLSARAAFTIDEIRTLATRAGLTGARITRHWPCRFLLDWRSP
jgi:hypothetical protein